VLHKNDKTQMHLPPIVPATPDIRGAKRLLRKGQELINESLNESYSFDSGDSSGSGGSPVLSRASRSPKSSPALPKDRIDRLPKEPLQPLEPLALNPKLLGLSGVPEHKIADSCIEEDSMPSIGLGSKTSLGNKSLANISSPRDPADPMHRGVLTNSKSEKHLGT
jgi:hypothetical protein